MSKIREERKMILYHRLKEICKDVTFYNDCSEIIYQSIINNVSTTELNQINIYLHNELRKYKNDSKIRY